MKKALLFMMCMGVVSISELWAQTTTTTKPSGSLCIYFDDIPGLTDVERLQKLPDLIDSRQQDTGVKYSLIGRRPQTAWLNTTVRVVFTSRIYDFKGVPEPVDMGSGFEFYGEGRPIFECGKNGFIRFSEFMSNFENIAFAGPSDNIPPLVIYGKGQGELALSNGEPKQWDPSGRSRRPDEEPARGWVHDYGKIVIRGCFFKGFGVCLRSQFKQGTDWAQIIITECTFSNVNQISDNLCFDSAVFEKSWVCPTFVSDKAVIVTTCNLNVRDVIFVPQSDAPEDPIKKPLKNMRWFDNYGWGLDIRCCRFGCESVNWGNEWLGEQVSVVYNYTKYKSTWINPDKTVESWFDPNFITIKDNFVYHRNVPMIKFFEIPNHVTISGNTGMNGWYKVLKDNRAIDRTVFCWFSPELKMPARNEAEFFSFDISNNIRAMKVTMNDANYLPEPLCYFGPKTQGLKNKAEAKKNGN